MHKSLRNMTKDFVFIIITERIGFPEMEYDLDSDERQTLSVLIEKLDPKELEDEYLTEYEADLLDRTLEAGVRLDKLIEWIMLVQSRVKKPNKASKCFDYSMQDWQDWFSSLREFVQAQRVQG